MTTEQEQKLKRFLAGRLETEIGIYPDGNLYWVESGNYVLDTELLEICHRIEMGLSKIDHFRPSDFTSARAEYFCRLLCIVRGWDITEFRVPTTGFVPADLLDLASATWQQRSTALAELFGEEI